ncbi:MAG: flavin reductase family protein [Marinilabiliaceae bacterium]|nr:flavin reductase family protein [Marinilabiliaceae bacterium]
MRNLFYLALVLLFTNCFETQKRDNPMENRHLEIAPQEISDNVIKLIGNDWMLITAGTKDSFNMMTASWGMVGHLWNQPVVFVFVRPQRYTYEFMEKSDYFTLTFFDEQYRDILNYCGTKSGRDVNKVAETGLIPIETQLGNIYFEQARLVIECEKIYFDDIKEDGFINKLIPQDFYPEKDFHRVYVGKIIKVLTSDK